MKRIILLSMFLVSCGKDSDEGVQLLSPKVSCEYVETETVKHCKPFVGCKTFDQNQYACSIEYKDETQECSVFENAENETVTATDCVGFDGEPIKWPEHKPSPQ